MNCLIATAASCYLGLTVGWMDSNNTDNNNKIEAADDNQPTAGIIAGVGFHRVRLETELRWQRQELHGYNPSGLGPGESANGNVDTVALLGNVRLQPDWRFSPYILGGAGPAYQKRDGHSSITNTDLDREGIFFAWQAGIGLSMQFTRTLEVDLGYRHFETEDKEQQGLILSVRYHFENQ